ncbi:MAG TPA: HD domain-containing protein [Gemmatimonadaceae bacterium]|nr:HD domain-containing protein [Gemmatimonadaceae bacterium]
MSRSFLELPAWARVSEWRRGHIERVVSLLEDWALEMNVPDAERQAWVDAGCWHDALRDAPADELRQWAGGTAYEAEMLHGPAAAARLEAAGERRTEVLDAIRFHTVGSAQWGRTGRALYLADFLEPGRPFAAQDRAFLAALVPRDFNGVFRQVVRMRLEWALREGHALFLETVMLWNEVR